jgi:putative DNA primase/helicase
VGVNFEPLGYVFRVIGKGGKKFTPTVTWCENAAGDQRWSVVPFTRPLPLYCLERLAARPAATVVLVEGEKTAEAAQRLLPSMVATTWPGGSNAYRHVDFSPLGGRTVICIPDADRPGREAFRGRWGQYGRRVPGILEMLPSLGAIPRLIQLDPDLSEGWDLADAEAEGWDRPQALAWLRNGLGACNAA